jgi:hypothetical protein
LAAAVVVVVAAAVAAVAAVAAAVNTQVRLLLGMLCTPPWCYYPLTLQVLEEEHARLMAGERAAAEGCMSRHSARGLHGMQQLQAT